MKALVTGATGFVGSAVARRLLAAGVETRVLVRPESSHRNISGLTVEVVTGDLNDDASLRRAMRGCDALFHVAADYRLWVPEPATLYRTNVEGTKRLLRAAAEAGAKCIVYTSSVATLGINKDRTPADETTPVSMGDMVGHYKRSKFLAEEAVLQLAATEGAPVVIVNPSAPIGPRDIRPTPTGRIIVDMLAGRMPAYVDTGLNVVHVEDVAEGHWLAFQKGGIGQRYVLGGENLSLRDILHLIAAIGSRPAPRIKLPHGVVLPIAWLAECVSHITGREPFATVDGVRMARKHMYFSSAKAQQDLGYVSRPARAAIEDAIRWFKESGYLGKL
jgi:dihydroflavonol-4-reductase